MYIHTHTHTQLMEAARDAEKKPVVVLGDVGTRRVDTAGVCVCVCVCQWEGLAMSGMTHMSSAPLIHPLPSHKHTARHTHTHTHTHTVLLHSLTAPNQLPALRMSAKEINADPARFFGGKGR